MHGERRRLAEIGVVFVSDARMRRLNRTYLSHDRTTDVISFGYDQGIGEEGEVIVNLDQARRQAARFDVTFRTEVSRLIVHGLLHVFGYDDRTSRQKALMTRREDKYIA